MLSSSHLFYSWASPWCPQSQWSLAWPHPRPAARRCRAARTRPVVSWQPSSSDLSIADNPLLSHFRCLPIILSVIITIANTEIATTKVINQPSQILYGKTEHNFEGNEPAENSWNLCCEAAWFEFNSLKDIQMDSNEASYTNSNTLLIPLLFLLLIL